MVNITFVQPDGTQKAVTADAGLSLMRAALDNGIAGMMGDCGGELSCATCHAYLDPAYLEKAGSPGEEEREMLECAAAEVRATSRLACQVTLTEALDGMTVVMPEKQA